MKLVFRNSLVILTIFIASCSSSSTVTREGASPTISPNVSIASAIPALSLSTETITTLPDLTRLKNECHDIYTKEHVTASWNTNTPALNGSLILDSGGQIYMLNIETDSKKVISDESYGVAVSLDRTKLAYVNADGRIIITDISGNILAQTENSDNHTDIIEWLDNQRLIVENYWLDENDLSQASLVILNPFNKEETVFSPNFPDMRFTPNEIMWTFSLLLPNKSLSRLIYPTWERGFALWDLNKNIKIKQLSWFVGVYKPEWSPNGEKFVQSVPFRETDSGIAVNQQNTEVIHFDDGLPYVGGSDILSVNQAGEIERITYLTTKYPAEERYLTWSPDGKTIAFLAYLFHGSIPQLSTVDVATGEITSYCLGPGTDYYSGTEIVWSPDGTQLAFTQDTPEKGVVLVDLSIDTAFYITQGADVVGWMVNNP